MEEQRADYAEIAAKAIADAILSPPAKMPWPSEHKSFMVRAYDLANRHQHDAEADPKAFVKELFKQLDMAIADHRYDSRE